MGGREGFSRDSSLLQNQKYTMCQQKLIVCNGVGKIHEASGQFSNSVKKV
jgi:hypothetical protein